MKISLFYDLVCPWCYIGHKRLVQALAAYPADKVTLEYRPFQLAPDMPREVSRDAYYRQRGMDPGVMQQSQVRSTAEAKTLGLHVDYSLSSTIANSRDAHRLVAWAPQDKKGVLVDALFAAYFGRGKSLGNVADLAQVAASVGVADVARATTFLEGTELADRVKQDVQAAYQLPIITVPYMVVNERFPVQFVHMPGVAEFALMNLWEG